MTERLDRIEAIQETSTAYISELAAQQETSTNHITDLITISRKVMLAVENLSETYESLRREVRENTRRFEVLRREAIADRRALEDRLEAERRHTELRFNALLLEIQSAHQRVAAIEQSGEQMPSGGQMEAQAGEQTAE